MRVVKTEFWPRLHSYYLHIEAAAHTFALWDNRHIPRPRRQFFHRYDWLASLFKTSRDYPASLSPTQLPAFAGTKACGRTAAGSSIPGGLPPLPGVAAGFGTRHPHPNRRTRGLGRSHAFWDFSCRPEAACLSDRQDRFGEDDIAQEHDRPAHCSGTRRWPD